MLHEHQTYIVLPKYPYLIVNGLTSKPLAQPYRLTGDSSYFCFEDAASQFIEDACVAELLKFSKNMSSCTLIPVKYERVLLIQKIRSNRWIVFSKENIPIQNICANEIQQEKLQGLTRTYIITIEDACEVKINKFSLKLQHHHKEKIEYVSLPIINLPHISEIKTNEERKPVELENIDLESVQKMIVKSSVSENETSDIKIYSVSLWTIVLYLIIAVCGVTMLYCRLKKLGYKCNFRNSPNSSNSDNPESQGGEVMRPGSGPAVFTIRA